MKKYIEINQDEINLYLFKITAEELVDKTEVSIFGRENPEGYQRPLSKIHVNNIVKFIESEEYPKITSSFILAADYDSIEFDFSNKEIVNFKKLRLVDGQHRAEAFRVLKSKNITKYNMVKNIELPATLIVSKSEDASRSRLYEIQAFLDLNSKGKKVPTDLAIRLRDEIRSVLGIRTSEDILEHISTNVTLKLNNDKNNSLWYKAINTEPLERSGVISINAFIRSLKKMLNSYLLTRYSDVNYLLKNFQEMEKFIDEFYEFLCKVWRIVSEKWPKSFIDGIVKANKNYVIQKGMGVNSIHLILSELIDENGLELIYYNFEKELRLSKITSDDWLVGGSFNGLSSQAGYKMISEYVRNRKSTDDLNLF